MLSRSLRIVSELLTDVFRSATGPFGEVVRSDGVFQGGLGRHVFRHVLEP